MNVHCSTANLSEPNSVWWCGRGSCYANKLSLGYLSNSRSKKEVNSRTFRLRTSSSATKLCVRFHCISLLFLSLCTYVSGHSLSLWYPLWYPQSWLVSDYYPHLQQTGTDRCGAGHTCLYTYTYIEWLHHTDQVQTPLSQARMTNMHANT